MNIKSINNVSGKPNLHSNGVTQVKGEDAFNQILEKRKVSADSIERKAELPWKNIDFEYNSTDELLEQISKRYNMEKLKPCELSQILNMLKEGGVITSDEYWLGQSVIPIAGSASDFPKPENFENALKDYYSNFKTYVDKNAHLYSPKGAQRLHDSVLVHQKIDALFHQIQSYR